MRRSAILASGVLVSLGFFLQACSSSDGSTPGEVAGETGGFSYGGLGGGGTPGGGNPGGGVSGAGFGGSGFAGTTGVAGTGQGGAGVGGTGAGGATYGAGGEGVGAAGAGGVGAGGATAVGKPPCITNGATQGAILGDSYVTGALSPALQPELAKVEPVTGQFKNYAVAGTSLASGGIGFIPPQLDSAIAASKTIKLIVMDGGGNDVLICNQTMYPGCNTKCNTTGSSTVKVCQDIVQAALDTSKTMMQKAADAGVKDVVYFYYPHIPSNNGGYSEILDYAEPKAKTLCEAAITNTAGKLSCHWVSLVAAFIAAGGDKNPANFAIDGIHPSAAGQTIIAGEISKIMKANNLGLASGECTP